MLIILATPFTPYLLLIIATSFLVATVPFVAYLKSIRLWKLGYPSARYFVIAFSFFVFAVLVFVTSKFGFIDRNILTEYSVHFGALIVVIFLYLAIADQLNQDRKDKEIAQEESILSLKKYQELYTHSYEGLFRLDKTGQFIAANPSCLKMLGADDLSQLQSTFGDFAAMVLNDNDKLLDKLKIQENTTNLDVLCQRVDGEQIWITVNTRLSHNSFGQVESIEGSMIDVSDRKDNESRLRYLANYDQLTGLINRNAFQERLKKLIDYVRNSHSESALLFIDLDRFKLVNDTCGHLAGDELLKQLGVIFTHQVRQRDATARIGGDEFAIYCKIVTSNGHHK